MRVQALIPLVAVAIGARAGDRPMNRLSEDEARQGYELLFNGRDLHGWDGDPELWRVERGLIVGSTDARPLRENSFLISLREFADFELRFEVRLRNGNKRHAVPQRAHRWLDRARLSGRLCRRQGLGQSTRRGSARGLILDGWQDKAEFVARAGWNSVTLRCEGHRIRISVNGLQVNDVLEPGSLAGVVAMQLHRGEAMRVEYRNIRILELGQESSDPQDSRSGPKTTAGPYDQN